MVQQRAADLKSNFSGAAAKIEGFGRDARRDAGSAAESTAATVKDAAGAVMRLPATRLVNGQERCALAANGAPDCVAAAKALCRAKGFASGKSAATITAEVCKVEVYLAGRNSGPGCHTETSVSRALCQ